MSTTKRRPVNQKETIFEREYRIKKEAQQLSLNHVDVKPIRYLLK